MIKKILSAAIFIFWANLGYSFIDVEGFCGSRWYQTKNASGNNFNATGTAYSAGVNVDPIPLIPLSVGANYTLVKLDPSDFGSPNVAQIRELGVDVKSWLSIFPWVTPYVRGRYVLSSKLNLTYDNNPNSNVDTNLFGFHVGAGLEGRIFPFTFLHLEFDRAFEKAESYAGQKQNFNSSSIMVGLSVGI